MMKTKTCENLRRLEGTGRRGKGLDLDCMEMGREANISTPSTRKTMSFNKHKHATNKGSSSTTATTTAPIVNAVPGMADGGGLGWTAPALGLRLGGVIASSFKSEKIEYSNRIEKLIRLPMHFCLRSLSSLGTICCSIMGGRKGKEPSLQSLITRNIIVLTSILILLVIDINFTLLNLCSAQKLIYKSHIPTTNIVIPHIKYGQGLNRWSFLSVDRNNRKKFLKLLGN